MNTFNPNDSIFIFSHKVRWPAEDLMPGRFDQLRFAFLNLLIFGALGICFGARRGTFRSLVKKRALAKKNDLLDIYRKV